MERLSHLVTGSGATCNHCSAELPARSPETQRAEPRPAPDLQRRAGTGAREGSGNTALPRYSRTLKCVARPTGEAVSPPAPPRGSLAAAPEP